MGEFGSSWQGQAVFQNDPNRRIMRPFKLPKKDEGLRMRLIAARSDDGKRYRYMNYYGDTAQQEPFYINHQAYYPKKDPHTGRATGDYVPCSCGGGRLADAQCAPHKYLADAPRGTKRPRPQPHFALQVVLLGKWHEVNMSNWDEAKEKKSEWTEWRQCTQQLSPAGNYIPGTCEACDTDPPYRAIYGQRQYINPGYGHWTQLLDYDRQIGNEWCACGKGRPYSVDLHCPNCGRIFADTSRLAVVDVDMQRNEVYCPGCKTNVRLAETLSCRIVDEQTGQATPGCSKPQRAGMFDVDFKSIYTVGTEKDTKIQIAGWSPPRPLPEVYSECLKVYDFADMFKLGVEAQCKLMGITNPFRGSQQKAVDYT